MVIIYIKVRKMVIILQIGSIFFYSILMEIIVYYLFK